MTTKTNLNAGKLASNHNQTMVRDSGKNLKTKTRVRAGQPVKVTWTWVS
ncbi:MAG TPA: hypothetical protein VJN43_03270 [Bryobacteraceae bacterium]|nr:hypothetical protein [Bryobacteraceae bacterium]